MFESMILHREQAENRVTKHFFSLIDPRRFFLEVENQFHLSDWQLRLNNIFERFLKKISENFALMTM